MELELNDVIGKNIKRLRKQKNMTIPELAEELEFAISTISNWENGKKTPRAGAVRKLADFFGVTINEITEDKSLREISRDMFKPQLVDINDFILDPSIRIVHNEHFLTLDERKLISRLIDAALQGDEN